MDGTRSPPRNGRWTSHHALVCDRSTASLCAGYPATPHATQLSQDVANLGGMSTIFSLELTANFRFFLTAFLTEVLTKVLTEVSHKGPHSSSRLEPHRVSVQPRNTRPRVGPQRLP